jgi:hypothetical protein
MKASFLISVLAVFSLVGCYETVPLVKLDIDERLLARCPKTLPVLTSAEDTAGLEWSSAMLSLYATCAKNQDSLAKVIEAYNEKIDAATKKLGTERSE